MTRTRLGPLAALIGLYGIAVGCTHAPQNALPTPQISAPPHLAVGQRVRVSAPGYGMLEEVADVTALPTDSITLTANRRSATVPLAAVRQIDVSLGRRNGAARGLLKGTLIGVGIGGILGVLGSVDCSGLGCGVGLIVLPPMGAVIGAMIGTIGGAAHSYDLWAPIPLDPPGQLRVGLVPQPGGRLGLGASLAF
jgi:hypothetical protein